MNIMTINVNRSIIERTNAYEAVRSSWDANLERAKRADVVLAIVGNICVGAFRPLEWFEIPLNESDPSGRTPKIGFDGGPAPRNVRARYVGQVLPERMHGEQGAANPVRYYYD